jgi:hypothetical protein
VASCRRFRACGCRDSKFHARGPRSCHVGHRNVDPRLSDCVLSDIPSCLNPATIGQMQERMRAWSCDDRQVRAHRQARHFRTDPSEAGSWGRARQKAGTIDGPMESYLFLVTHMPAHPDAARNSKVPSQPQLAAQFKRI